MKPTVSARKNWRSNIHLNFDSTCMPELREALKTTKTEISRKIFNSQNSDLAEKVLKGKDTDMGKILGLCNYFGIDICQFIIDDKGRHPKLVFEEFHSEQTDNTEMLHLEENLMERNGKPERFPLNAVVPAARESENDGLLNQSNASQLIEALTESIHHQRTLYNQIAELKAEVAMLRERASERF